MSQTQAPTTGPGGTGPEPGPVVVAEHLPAAAAPPPGLSTTPATSVRNGWPAWKRSV
ncbi:hypothetical protein HNR25_005132 [Streptomonospora salina]|uniref:Uncharacterized protein n=1 Tax=Streptomonospora salina TaxID=104205 RepID=A0A841EJV2_9ACTN|nr:hypothetical protein [Streptomonospora salina]